MPDPFREIRYMSEELGEIKKGDRLHHPRIGECELARYDRQSNRLEVYDKYGMIRHIPLQEIQQCQLVWSRNY